MARSPPQELRWSVWAIVVLILFSVLNWVLFSSFKIRVYYTIIPALLALQLFLNNLVEYLLVSKVRGTRWFSFLVSPGTILHELSHAVAAVVSGCKVTSLSLFSPNARTGVLGSVTYLQKRDRLSFPRDLLIAFSPFFGCSLAMMLVFKYVFSYSLTVDLFQMDLVGVVYRVFGSMRLIAEQYSSMALGEPLKLVALYLQLCFAFGAAPSGFDFHGLMQSAKRNILGVLMLVFFILFAAFAVDGSLPLGAYGVLLSDAVIVSLNWVILLISLSVGLLVFSLILLYSTSNWLNAGWVCRVSSLLAAAAVYYLSVVYGFPSFASALACWLAFYLVIFTGSNSGFFLRER